MACCGDFLEVPLIFHRAFIMSQSFGGKLELYEDGMVAPSGDRMGRGILERHRGRIFDTLVVVVCRIAATARDIPLLRWI